MKADIPMNEVIPEIQIGSLTNYIETQITPNNSPSKRDSLPVAYRTDLDPENLPRSSVIIFFPEDLRPTFKAEKEVATRKLRQADRKRNGCFKQAYEEYR